MSNIMMDMILPPAPVSRSPSPATAMPELIVEAADSMAPLAQEIIQPLPVKWEVEEKNVIQKLLAESTAATDKQEPEQHVNMSTPQMGTGTCTPQRQQAPR